MPESLLWINKDVASEVLSRSSKAETRKIRKHVQHERQLKAKAAQEVTSKPVSPPRKTSRSERSIVHSEQALEQIPLRQRGLKLDTNIEGYKQSDEYRSCQLAALSASLSPTTQSTRVLHTITSFPGLDTAELRSLAFFCQRTAPEWSGWRDASFWNKLILQACHLNRSILHGVVALGALHESSEIDGESDERSSLQDIALHQSSKASRLAVETAVSDISTLISCIIFICMQNLQDSHTAYQLLKTGHSLISDIDRRLLSGELILAESEKTVLNSFLRPIIERLRMRFCCIVDVPSALAISAALRKSKMEVPLSLPSIPTVFSSLLEARNKLELIIEWAQENVDPSKLSLQGHSQTQNLLSMWIDALDRNSASTLERYDALISSKKLLKSAALVASILIDTLGTHSECNYDDHVDKFAEIIQLYKVALGDHYRSPRRVSFGIDSGVIDTLSFIAGRCRDPIIRREAIDLLIQTNRMEGDLQGTTGSTILSKLIELEEEGLDVSCASDIPETSRLRIWEDHQYWDKGEIQIFFVHWPYEPSLGAEIKQVKVQLPMKALRGPKELAAPNSPIAHLPNVKYGRGVGAFLDESTQTYHQITLSSFFMPMPRL
ncbi:hypothetical protein LTR84_001201 [Exophiala bonariae]|uniref:Uncharacterized protein n=1 Tax=Exophiala bonariae TaxID=1690606 RepID=A0AAV9NWF4_9EURO|nr:hypothetical protein LTR84_001201 [Exophiala bonariae]